MARCNERSLSGFALGLVATAAFLAASATSDALTLRVQPAFATEVPLVVVPCAPGVPAPRVLLAQRVLVQTRNAGKPQAPTIPNWAGQWGAFVGSPVGAGEPLQRTAARLFFAQTGVDLPNAAKAVIESDSSDLEVTRYAIVPLSEDQLTQLAAAVAQAIADRAPQDGVLSAVEAVSFPEALARIGPVPSPPAGWASFVIENVYGGQSPGALDIVFPTLVNLISRRTTESPDVFQSALLLAARSCAGSPAQP